MLRLRYACSVWLSTLNRPKNYQRPLPLINVSSRHKTCNLNMWGSSSPNQICITWNSRNLVWLIHLSGSRDEDWKKAFFHFAPFPYGVPGEVGPRRVVLGSPLPGGDILRAVWSKYCPTWLITLYWARNPAPQGEHARPAPSCKHKRHSDDDHDNRDQVSVRVTSRGGQFQWRHPFA